LILALVWVTLYAGISRVEPTEKLESKIPHIYEKEDMPIDKISILVYYFIPKDRLDDSINNWKAVTDPHLQDLLKFHEVQFFGTSKISYDFFPQPIVGEKTGAEYETNISEHYGSGEMSSIIEEMTKRVLSEGGDYYDPKDTSGERGRRVYLVVFEGEGAAGSGDFGLISRSYLTLSAYQTFSSTFLAHEFYHTLGLPDNYDESSYVFGDSQQVSMLNLTSKDIMGYVRVPIESTYIERETLQKMGL